MNINFRRHSQSWLMAVLIALLMPFGLAAQAQDARPLPDHVISAYGYPPAIPEGALAPDTQAALDLLVRISVDQSNWNPLQTEALEAVAASRDPRLGWIVTDMMRFAWKPEFGAALGKTATSLLGIELESRRHQPEIIDNLIAWRVPAYPGYLAHKRVVYTNYLAGMDRLFVEGDIDWRLVGWGGVNIDDRPFGTTDDFCNCIPAADNPAVSSAADATWLKDDDIVFGITVNGESRAYPRRIMEIREMVNDTLGGRDLGIPYCTLCGAAQAYFTDGLPAGIERPVLRTSGLLIRSNKVMYDRNTYSVFDTFLGKAVTGPLAKRNLQLEQASVVTTQWGAWKAAHPDTTVLVEALALGRDFDLRNTRDANGPIFPIGDVDPRLPVQEDIIGVVTASGKPVAFQRSTAFLALQNGQQIGFENVRLVMDAGGIRAVDANGADLGSHQAFWFAWSQFYPATELWSG